MKMRTTTKARRLLDDAASEGFKVTETPYFSHIERNKNWRLTVTVDGVVYYGRMTTDLARHSRVTQKHARTLLGLTEVR